MASLLWLFSLEAQIACLMYAMHEALAASSYALDNACYKSYNQARAKEHDMWVECIF